MPRRFNGKRLGLRSDLVVDRLIGRVSDIILTGMRLKSRYFSGADYVTIM